MIESMTSLQKICFLLLVFAFVVLGDHESGQDTAPLYPNDDLLDLLNLMSKSAESEEKPKPCTNPMPGLYQMARGVDIVFLDLYPAKRNKFANGFRHMVLGYSCESDKKWSHSGNVTFDYPDQVSVTFDTSLPESKSHSPKSILMNDLKQLKEALMRNVNLKMNYNSSYGAFIGSETYRNTREQLLGSMHKSVAEVSTTFPNSTTTRIDSAKDHHLLYPNFKRFIESKLSGHTFAERPYLFLAFIKLYGTHYFESATLGGALKQSTHVNVKDSARSEGEILSNLERSFVERFKLANPTNKRQNESTTNEALESHYYLYGGPSSSDPSNFTLSAWTLTIPENPWILSGTLSPIEQLISNTTLKNEVRKAIRVYRMIAHFKDVKASVKLSGAQLSSQDQEIIDEFAKGLRVMTNGGGSAGDMERLAQLVTQLDRVQVKVQQSRG